MYKRFYLIILFIIAITAITLTSTYLFYDTALTASETFLSSHATALSATLEASLRQFGLKAEIFKDIIQNGRWDGIAFLALYDKNRKTLLHSNERLIGKKVEEAELPLMSESDFSRVMHVTLGTGEKVFVLDTKMAIEGKESVLRIALHPYPSQTIIKKARLLFISVSVMLIVFWAVSILLIRSIRNRLRIEMIMAHNERLAMIGRMASVLAHEIRNPLGIIKGFAQHLREKSVCSKEGKGIDIIVRESQRLELLTEDLLMYARMDELRPEEFDLPSLIRDAAGLLRIENKSIDMDFDMPDKLIILSDREKLRQVVYNLLQNSVDAIEQKGKITMHLAKERDHAVIFLSDTGKGIAPNDIEKIFAPFYTTKSKGTGLGLSIAEKLIKTLGGSISVKSEQGRYTTFKIKVPDLRRINYIN